MTSLWQQTGCQVWLGNMVKKVDNQRDPQWPNGQDRRLVIKRSAVQIPLLPGPIHFFTNRVPSILSAWSHRFAFCSKGIRGERKREWRFKAKRGDGNERERKREDYV